VVSGANVPFGGQDDDQLRLGVQTPKNRNFGAVNMHFKIETPWAPIVAREGPN